MNRRIAPWIAALSLALAAGAAAQVDDRSGAFDQATGRNLLNYPPDRQVDLRHMKLEITIADMNAMRFEAIATLSFTPFRSGMRSIDLDAVNLDIHAVRSPGRRVAFESKPEKLILTFDPPLVRDEPVEVSIEYAAFDPAPGMVWTPESPRWPGRPPQLHTLGQSEWNRYWFPGRDFPNERLTTELIVAVPKGFEVISNGRLVSREPGWLVADRSRELEVFTWLQDKPHVTYLVSLVVGKFDTTDVGSRRLPMPVNVPAGMPGDVRGTFGGTSEMVRTFERAVDEPYPWDRYAQVLVWNFAAGGMEHTSATTLFLGSVLTKEDLVDHDMEDLIAHELFHQWFGDLLTCNSWEHIWLNEGFATYGEYLWAERAHGPETALALAQSWLDSLDRDDCDAPFQPAMASCQYANPDDTFGREADAYAKGGLVLHALRRRLGDEVFFKGLSTYVDRFKFRTVESDDFRHVMEEVSGESLEQFFDQHVSRPGIPDFDVSWVWSEGVLSVSVEQVQNIDGANPAFELDLPMCVLDADGDERWATLHIDARSTTAVYSAPEPVVSIAFDPWLTTLARINASQRLEQWLLQLRSGPTIAAKIRALRAIGEYGDAFDAFPVLEVARSAAAPRALREEAVKALASIPDHSFLLSLTQDPPRDPWVRARLAAGLASAGINDSEFAAKCSDWLDRAMNDSSSRVRSEAVRAAGQLQIAAFLPAVRSLAASADTHPQVLEAALDAIDMLGDDSDALRVLALCDRPVLPHLRAQALRTAASLAQSDDSRAAVMSSLLAAAFDREVPIADAARQMLVESRRPEARRTLERLRDATRDPVRRRAIDADLAAMSREEPENGAARE